MAKQESIRYSKAITVKFGLRKEKSVHTTQHPFNLKLENGRKGKHNIQQSYYHKTLFEKTKIHTVLHNVHST